MTDLPFSDDELLSSFLDGELTDEERSRVDARLETEPEFAAHLATLRAAAALAATPVTPLRTGDTDRLIAAALAASAPASNVTELGADRGGRSDPWRRRIMSVAAAVVLLAIAVPALRSIDRSGDDADTAATAEAGGDAAMDTGALSSQSADSSMDMADEAAIVPDADGGEAAADAAAVDPVTSPGFDAYNALLAPRDDFDPFPDDLGSFADLAAMNAAARDAWNAGLLRDAEDDFGDSGPAPADTTPTEETLDDSSSRTAAAAYLEQFGGCGSAIDTISAFPYPAPPVAVDYATATIDGEEATIGLFLLADDTGVFIVIDSDGCTIRYDEVLLGP